MNLIAYAVPILSSFQGNVAMNRSFEIGGVNLMRRGGMRREMGLTKAQDSRVVAGFQALQRYLAPHYEMPAFWESLKHRRADPVEQRILKERWQRQEAVAKERKRREDQIFAIATPAQRARLKELHIRLAGPSILHHPDLARTIAATPDQIQGILRLNSERMAIESRRKLGSPAYDLARAAEDREWEARYIALFSSSQVEAIRKLGGKPVDRYRLMENYIPVVPGK